MTTHSPSEEPARVLVVDDSPSSLKMISDILSREFEVVSVSEGHKTVEVARESRPDLILLDVVMQDMDGYEICQRLKNEGDTHHIPVVFVTANTKGRDETRGLDVGAVDYVTKPFDAAILKTRIRNHIRRHRYKWTIQNLLRQNQTILNAAGEGICGLDAHGRITFINPAACAILGWASPEELVGAAFHARIQHSRANGTPHPQEKSLILTAIREKTVHRSDDAVFWRKDGTCFPVAYVSTPVQEMDRTSASPVTKHGAVLVFRDITHQKSLEAREVRSQISSIAISALLETSLEPLSLTQQLRVALQIILSVSWLSIEYKGSILLVDDTEPGMLVTVVQVGLPDVLQKRCARIPFDCCLCGLAAQSQQLVFRNALDHKHDIMYDGIHEHGHYCVPLFFQQKLIGVLNLYLPHNHIQDPEEDAFVVTIANTLAGLVMRRKLEAALEQSRKALDHQARHDRLTGLPNRMLFHERVEQALLRARRDRNKMALLFVDLDRFKQVNDAFGHEAGDRLLVHVSRTIQGLLREVDTVARMGGDEFTVILSGIHHEADATLVAEKMIHLLQKPFTVGDHVCEIGASVGISLFPSHASDAETLLNKADAAMYCVKGKGRNAFLVYHPDMDHTPPSQENA